MRGRWFRLCLILTRASTRLPPLETLRLCLAGGVDLVQIREKEAHASELAAWTRQALPLCRAAGAPLVVNDSIEVALAVGADGVHLGQEDLAPALARRLLGPDALIGWSTHDQPQLEVAIQLQREGEIDYVGFGPAFPSATKGCARGLGAERVREAAKLARQAGLPLLAIGGITVENRGLLGDEAGLAVSASLCAAPDPGAVAQALLA